MRIAFYAPLKPPTHPVPSGDREMARNLMRLLTYEGRAEVLLASELRLRDGVGDTALQNGLRAGAARETDRLVRDLPADTALWVTYHNYYKAPDLIGPEVARRRGLRYVQIESTRAQKRLTGPWAGFAQAAEAASDAADLIFYPTQHDRFTLERDRAGDQILCHLPPFLPLETLPAAGRANPGRLLAAGMMRPGDKMASYTLIAETLALLKRDDWHLHIAGDGPARGAVEDLFRPFGARVRLLGQLDPVALAKGYRGADLLVWPGVNEAFGMVYLEAHAAGLPIVAQDRPGVRDVVSGGRLPDVADGPAALAARIGTLVDDRAARATAGAEARRFVAASHLLPAAADRFWTAIAPLVGVSA